MLPAFVSAEHGAELDLLKVTWAHGTALCMDLTHEHSWSRSTSTGVL